MMRLVLHACEVTRQLYVVFEDLDQRGEMTSLLVTVLWYLLMSIPVGFILKFQSSGSVVADISPPFS